MLNKLNNLAFVIGAFFTLIAIILLVHFLVKGAENLLTLYTSGTFIVFGLLMMFAGNKKK